MGHLESLLGQVERHDYPVGRDLTLAARAELAEREAETEELRRLLGVQIAVHATESRELAEKDARIDRLTAALDGASRSLTAIAIADTEDGNEYLKDVRETRRFAGSRAEVAREDLSTPTDSGTPTTAKLVPVEGIRPEVLWFASKMEERLRANDHKGGWHECDWDFLQGRMADEADELVALLRSSGITQTERIWHEAADVANFAMMIADNARLSALDGNEYLKDVRETRRFAGSRAEVAREDLSTPTDSGAPTTAKLVPVERLRQIDKAIHYQLDSQEIGPLCSYVAALLREETVPPKPTPPPLREIREGRVPARAGAGGEVAGEVTGEGARA
jgi:hypothetical protein